MNRSILESDIAEFEKNRKKQNGFKEESESKIKKLRKRLNEEDGKTLYTLLINDLEDEISEQKKEIDLQMERSSGARENIDDAEKEHKKKPQDRQLKREFKRLEFEIINSDAIVKERQKKINKLQSLISDYKESMTKKPDSAKDVYHQIIENEKSIINGIEQYLKLEQDRIDRDTKFVEHEEEQQKRNRVFVFDPNIEPHQITRALNTNVRKRISSVSEINEKTIKMSSKFVRAKHESAKDRAEFLIRCRQFESQQEIDEADEDRYAETSEALRTLSSWIAANAAEDDDGDVPDKNAIFEGDKTELKQLYELSMLIINNKLFLPEEKFDLAVSFFTIGAIEYCYSMFLAILKSPYTRANEKAEACKFLYYADDDQYIPEIEKYTMEILENDELEDRFKYETIACYLSNLGLKTKYIHTRLPTDGVDHELVTNLFLKFVDMDIHPDYKILGYTTLLEQEHDESIKPDIEKRLLEMAKSTSFSKVDDEDKYKIHRIRADAADVVVRRPDSPYNKEAFEIVMELGEQEEDLEINRTVYTNAENVHLLNDKALEYVEQIYSQGFKKFTKIENVVRDIELMADRYQLSLEDRALIRKSLDRLILDSSRFTKFKITMTTILLCLYNEITNHKSKKRLMARLLEELIDMAETCASGHAKRLINTMVGYTDKLEGIMDITHQLEANVKARVMASINHMKEGPEKDAIVDAMSSDSDNRDVFKDHVEKVFRGGIEQELVEEFVVGGFISREKFDKCVKDVLEKL